MLLAILFQLFANTDKTNSMSANSSYFYYMQLIYIYTKNERVVPTTLLQLNVSIYFTLSRKEVNKKTDFHFTIAQ